MDYVAWAQEYLESSEQLSHTIKKLNAQKKQASKFQRAQIEQRLSVHREARKECDEIANILLARARCEKA